MRGTQVRDVHETRVMRRYHRPIMSPRGFQNVFITFGRRQQQAVETGTGIRHNPGKRRKKRRNPISLDTGHC